MARGLRSVLWYSLSFDTMEMAVMRVCELLVCRFLEEPDWL
jgi:hypothetical protein